MRVLIAEDSSSLRQIEREIFARMGFSDVIEADDGTAALDLVDTHAPDLVLIDREMPGTGGVEVVRALRARSFTGPIVMVSTSARRNDVLEAIGAGVTCYVLKPFTPAALSARVQDAIGRTRAA